jgi:hypothetical protein
MKLNFHRDSEESWLRIGRVVIVLKTPKAAINFSERYGFLKPLISVRGYRLLLEVQPWQ